MNNPRISGNDKTRCAQSATTSAATGKTSAVKYRTRADVVRTSLRADAAILARRGLSHAAIASRLGITRRTVLRWLA